MTLDEIRGEHFYGIIPNGDFYTKGEAWMVDWCTKYKGGIARVPASGDRDRGISFGVQEPLEEAVRKAKLLAGDKYDVIVFRRLDEMTHSKDDHWTFFADRKA